MSVVHVNGATAHVQRQEIAILHISHYIYTVKRNLKANPLSAEGCCSDKCLEYHCKKDIEDLQSCLVTKGQQQQREIIM